jgi:hypothetical protein
MELKNVRSVSSLRKAGLRPRSAMRPTTEPGVVPHARVLRETDLSQRILHVTGVWVGQEYQKRSAAIHYRRQDHQKDAGKAARFLA